MFTPTALIKPTMTALDTKRSSPPSLSKPAATMTTPVIMVRVNRARAGSAAWCTAPTSATRIAIAPVPWTAMNAEEVATAPPTTPTM